MRRSTSFVCALMLAATAFLTTSACGGEETLVVASAEGPPAVEWVYTSEWKPYSGGGRGSLPIPTKHESRFLRIATDPPQEIAVDCHTPEPQLAVESTKRLVAHRCGSSTPWHLMHLGDPIVVDPRSTLGVDAEPDWAKAPALLVSVTHRINQGVAFTDVPKLIARVRATGGAAAVARLLVDTAGASSWFKYGKDGESHGEWKKSFASLPPDQQLAVRNALKGALGQPEITWQLARNALLALPPDDRPATTALLAAAEKLLATKELEVSSAVRDVVRRAAWSKPTEAAALACEVLGGRHGRDDADLLVIAATGFKCAHALDQINCADLLESKGCGEEGKWRLCDKAELEGRLAAELDAWKRPDAAGERSLDRGDYLLVIARAHDALPVELEAAARLRGYAVEQHDELGCDNFHITKDTPCKCWHLDDGFAPSTYRESLCEAALEDPNGPFVTKASDCRIEIDDKRRTIKVLGLKRLVGTTPAFASKDASVAK